MKSTYLTKIIFLSDTIFQVTCQVLAGTFPGVRHNNAEGKSFVLFLNKVMRKPGMRKS